METKNRSGSTTTFSTTVALLTFLLFVGCSNGESDPAQLPSGDDIGELAPGATEDGENGERRDTSGPVVTHEVVVTTDLGSFTIELYGEDAPVAVENFVRLAGEGYFDSIRFHRVVEDFIVQTGDSLTRDTAQRDRWGDGGNSIFGRPFASELDSESPSGRRGYRSGTVAMAGEGENNLSQFFIVLTDQAGAQIPYQHTIFGRVIDGMGTIEAIEETGRVEFDAPDGDGTEEGFVQSPPNPAMILNVTVSNVE